MPLTYVHACETGRWHLEVWRRGDREGTRRQIPFRCRSWRHEGECRLWCGACDFRRVEEAIQSLSPWLYMVMTYPKPPSANDQRKLFALGVKHWYSLRKRLEAEYGSLKYIQTWEIQRNGTPHTNVLIHCPSMFYALRNHERKLKRGWLLDQVLASGFGKEYWCEAMKSPSRMAGYLTKLARELTGAGVKNQVPVTAPRHFRRIRASVRLLPPRHKNPDVEGRLVKSVLPDPERTGLHEHGSLE